VTGSLSDLFDLLIVQDTQNKVEWGSRSHSPLGPKCVGQFVFRARYLFWNATNTVCTCTNIVHMHGRHGSSVAPNATGVAGARSMLDSGQYCKIKSGKSTRLSQRVPRDRRQYIYYHQKMGGEGGRGGGRENTHGLGMVASSSNDDAKGLWAGTAGE
jgi:hypothetical protein